MKIRNLKIFLSALLIGSISFIVFASGNDEVDENRRALLLKVISFALNNGHYSPVDIDDKFSEEAWELYIDRLDFSKRFLLQKDIDNLATYKFKLDDALMEEDFSFLDYSDDLITQRINQSESYYKDALKKPFDFSIDEWYEFDPDETDYAKTQDELKDRWRKSLKYETLARIHTMQEEQEKAAEKSDTVTIKSFAQMEEEAREKILKRYDDWFHRMSKLDNADRLNTYINSLVNVYDPHTQYFPPKDKENFDIRFSGQLEGIGAQLTQKNAYIEVSKIIPGSPSWKQGDLEVGDFILKVKQSGEEPVDVVDMRLDEAVQLIRGKKGTKVTLTIKKLDGTIEDITLVRDVVVLEETYAKSAVIKDEETGEKYGFIHLPSFYVDFSKINGKNCYDDVKDEVEKLKDENVAGIIFDIRDNGGGSLEDVVKIAGLFIETGPVVQARGRRDVNRVLRDTDSRIQYDGPMVVMVNAISASASEIFAAAMQDYDRAVIVGGNSTYGKGTVQNFTELDRMVPKKPANMDELGALKMTVQKFYRINGDATQLKGVTPDIVFPDYYNYMEFGEADLDYPMPFTEITPLTWDKWTPTYDEDFIIEMSKKRIKSDTLMNLIDENGKRLEKIREDTKYNLNYEKYTVLIDKREQESKRYDRISKDTLGLVIAVPEDDKDVILADTSRKARSDAWILGLKKDVYLSEAFHIIKDMNNYNVADVRKEEE
ncbi:MAG: carboxy terminal-processing peptidase [Bacteroidales bacterium]|nr:carboxy terminal-processing peptidase [Bacteroidales bacterium]